MVTNNRDIYSKSQWASKITIIMATIYSSASLVLRSTSASIKSTGFLFFILYLHCSKYT